MGNGIPGFYCSLGLAVSAEDGVTFEKLGQILTGERGKVPAGRADQGVGEPCLLRVGAYIYAYYTSHERLRGRTVDICLARCRWTDLFLGWHPVAAIQSASHLGCAKDVRDGREVDLCARWPGGPGGMAVLFLQPPLGMDTTREGASHDAQAADDPAGARLNEYAIWPVST